MRGVLKYRIGVIDDYHDYGELQVWNAARVGGPRQRQQGDDAIHVFLNFAKIGSYTKREEADSLIRYLLNAAPVSLKDFEGYVTGGHTCKAQGLEIGSKDEKPAKNLQAR